jgi:hypothetical protein
MSSPTPIIAGGHGKRLDSLVEELQRHGSIPDAQENSKPRGGDRYLELVCEVPLRPIRSELELDRAIATIDKLLDHDKRSEVGATGSQG